MGYEIHFWNSLKTTQYDQAAHEEILLSVDISFNYVLREKLKRLTIFTTS